MEKKNDYDVPQKVTPEFCLQCLENDQYWIRETCINYLAREYLTKGCSILNLYSPENGLNLGTKYFHENCRTLISALFTLVKDYDCRSHLERFLSLIDRIFEKSFHDGWYDHLWNYLLNFNSSNPLREKCAAIVSKYYNYQGFSRLPLLFKHSTNNPEFVDMILTTLKNNNLVDAREFGPHYLWEKIGQVVDKLNVQDQEKAIEIFMLLIPLADECTLWGIMRLQAKLNAENQQLIFQLVTQRCEQLKYSGSLDLGNLTAAISLLPFETAHRLFEYWLPKVCHVDNKEILINFLNLIVRNPQHNPKKHLQILRQHLQHDVLQDVMFQAFEYVKEPKKLTPELIIILIKWLTGCCELLKTIETPWLSRKLICSINHLINSTYQGQAQICSELNSLFLSVINNSSAENLINDLLLSISSNEKGQDWKKCFCQLELAQDSSKAEEFHQTMLKTASKSKTDRQRICIMFEFINQQYNFDWKLSEKTITKVDLEKEYYQKIQNLFA